MEYVWIGLVWVFSTVVAVIVCRKKGISLVHGIGFSVIFSGPLGLLIVLLLPRAAGGTRVPRPGSIVQCPECGRWMKGLRQYCPSCGVWLGYH